ncbi:Uncharacterised protein [uncultured archaeon]|nr:Uncharacterised protein [uncultured archaeon]
MSDPSEKKTAISFRVALIVATFFVLGFAAVSVLLSNQPEQRKIISNLYNIIVQFSATFGLLCAAYYSKNYGKRIQVAWIVLALAQFSFTIADIGFAYYDIFQGEVPYPSLADLPSLMFYFLFASGLLLLPRMLLTFSERTKMLLDMGIVMLAATMIYWALLIVPTIAGGAEESTLSMAVSVAYNVGDLVILFAIIELLLCSPESLAFIYAPFLIIFSS